MKKNLAATTNAPTAKQDAYTWYVLSNDQNTIRNLQEFLMSKNYDHEFISMKIGSEKEKMGRSLPHNLASEIINLLISNIDTYSKIFLYRLKKGAPISEIEPVEKKHARVLLENEEQESPVEILEEIGKIEDAHYLQLLKNKAELLVNTFTGKPANLLVLREKYNTIISNLRNLKGLDRKALLLLSPYLKELGYRLSIDGTNNRIQMVKK